MKKLAYVALGALLVSATVQADSHGQHVQESREAVKSFFGKLSGELQAAMQAGGPVKAIEVCSERAPAIASEVSADKNLKIARTSLKLRNPDNASDKWENNVLKEFEKRKENGEDLATMEYSEVVQQDGKQVFRYMKAIPTGDVCLACHGAQIDATVEGQLKRFYPKDKARGYKQGDIRGAFTIVKEL